MILNSPCFVVTCGSLGTSEMPLSLVPFNVGLLKFCVVTYWFVKVGYEGRA